MHRLVLLLSVGCATFDTTLTKGGEDGDGVADSGEPCTEQTWYADSDGDGHGGPTTLEACEAPDETGWVLQGEDCDDADAAVHPLAEEVCNEVDDDCDGTVDDDATDRQTWYADSDGDGFGDPEAPLQACSQPDAAVDDLADCDDGDAAVNPDATELCNGIDDDCNGEVDDAAADPETWYADTDADGHGDPDSTTQACSPPSGFVADPDDCDDTDASLWDDCSWPTSTTVVCGSGGYTPSLYDSGTITSPELHIVGLYEASPTRSSPVAIDLDRPGDVILVLSAYEAVDWQLTVSASTNLTHVVLNGYNAHTLSGAGSATVVRHDGVGTYWSACAYGWPATTGGCDTPALVTQAEAWAGVATRTFSGCYRASEAVVH